MDKLTIALT